MGYKVITKTLTNILKELMPYLSSPCQSNFVPGCQIIDNIVIYQEVLHSMRYRGASKSFMVIKIDLKKAYDRLSWTFIKDTLEKAGLPKIWSRNQGRTYVGAMVGYSPGYFFLNFFLPLLLSPVPHLARPLSTPSPYSIHEFEDTFEFQIHNNKP